MKGEISEETWNAVAEVQEQYWRIMEDPETRAIADLREKSIMDRKFLIAHAEKQARDKDKKEIAKKMKEEKIDIETIIKITDLSEERV